jgi:hypothetical protein
MVEQHVIEVERDSAYFSVIDDEWPTVRAALQARLDAVV